MHMYIVATLIINTIESEEQVMPYGEFYVLCIDFNLHNNYACTIYIYFT